MDSIGAIAFYMLFWGGILSLAAIWLYRRFPRHPGRRRQDPYPGHLGKCTGCCRTLPEEVGAVLAYGEPWCYTCLRVTRPMHYAELYRFATTHAPLRANIARIILKPRNGGTP